MISLSVSSETPADRPSAASDSGAARPRRALTPDADRVGSPTTPVRFPARTADDPAAGPDAADNAPLDDDATRQWNWRIPADGPDAPARPPGRRARRSAGPSDHTATPPDAPGSRTQSGGTGQPQPATTEPGTTSGATTTGTAPTRTPTEAPATPPAQSPRQGGPAKKAAAKKAAGKGGGKGKGGQRKGKGGQGGNRRRQFRVLQGLGPMEPREEIPDQSHLPPEQRTDLAVRVTNLSITYRTSFEKKPTLRQALMRFGRGERAVREVEALKDISFQVRTGTAMGIIGANGAGKSTLMRTMSGILPPTKGTVEVWGQASTLLALGVGFNNSLSGRENIILGGLAAGLSREEVEERANEIAEWTELGDFIDMPMRTYSSGMASRVAFSVGVHMEPDILMIDEALSTGDAHFKEKAAEKMAELRSKARAMFLVSHGLGTIKELCDEAIWIDKGVMKRQGKPDDVVDEYLDFMKARRSSATMDDF